MEFRKGRIALIGSLNCDSNSHDEKTTVATQADERCAACSCAYPFGLIFAIRSAAQNLSDILHGLRSAPQMQTPGGAASTAHLAAVVIAARTIARREVWRAARWQYNHESIADGLLNFPSTNFPTTSHIFHRSSSAPKQYPFLSRGSFSERQRRAPRDGRIETRGLTLRWSLRSAHHLDNQVASES